MASKIFADPIFVDKIKKRLPKFIFDLNKASEKDGKLSPDIGTLREKMFIGILKKHFPQDISFDIPPQESEADFIVFGEPISFKTSISKSFKLIWTANYEQAMRFYREFIPSCSIILLIFQKKVGGIYYFSKELLQNVRDEIGLNFLNKPKSGTNPRGVSLSTKCFNVLSNKDECEKILIDWDQIEEGKNTAVNFIEHYFNIW
ncbi:MAG: ThaI family type II restriction endonuclease [Promethearchaeota archaeon]